LEKERKLKILFLLVIVLFAESYLTVGPSRRATEIYAILIVLLAYLTGGIAAIIHLIAAFIGFISHLHILAGLSHLIAAGVAKIHFFIAGHLLKKGLKKTERYKRFHVMIVNSRAYQIIASLLHRFMKTLGFKKPRKVHIVELKECPLCEEHIPARGKFCPECGEQIKEKKED
jgi:hypothetical protein